MAQTVRGIQARAAGNRISKENVPIFFHTVLPTHKQAKLCPIGNLLFEYINPQDTPMRGIGDGLLPIASNEAIRTIGLRSLDPKRQADWMDLHRFTPSVCVIYTRVSRSHLINRI